MEMAEYVGTGLADLQRRTVMVLLFLSIDVGRAKGFV